eukprot:11999421-Prorocentrum_lima.AAC.1
MTSSLVGSEMCIRDRGFFLHRTCLQPWSVRGRFRYWPRVPLGPLRLPVSYTHLTLPTICSV